MKEGEKTLVNSIIKAFNVLEILAFKDYERNGISLSELSKLLDIKATTLHNILKTMIACGFVEQNESSKYLAGGKCLQIGLMNSIFSVNGISEKISPIMEELGSSVDESVILYILVNGNRVPVVQVEHKGAVRVDFDRLMQENLYEKATGRVLTAYANQFELKQILKKWGLPGENWDNINAENSLQVALEEIRQKGMCEIASQKDGLSSIAFPVIYPMGKIFGSIGCYVPLFRYDENKRNNIMEKLYNASKNIEKIL
jgi:IclR family acetate operon transcriptional repressor